MKVCILGHESRNVITTAAAQAGLKIQEEKKTLKEKRNPNGLPQNNKMMIPTMVPLPLLLQHKEGRLLQKGETKYSPSFNG